MKDLFAKVSDIEKICPHGWCGPQKAGILAALTIAIRPTTCVEIGVWAGQSAIPVALALKEIGRGTLYCIDPWNAADSVVGQDGANLKWWGEQDHDAIYREFNRAIREMAVENCIRVIRDKSDNVDPPNPIDLLHIDGNHSDQAIKDVERFGSQVRPGGYCCTDDLDWQGGGVVRAVNRLKMFGFVQIYRIGTGAMFQRLHT